MGVYSATVAALAPLLIGLVAGNDLRSVRINFGSCNDGNKTQMLWPFIQAREPDLWIWGGDNIYGDDKPRSLIEIIEWVKARENPFEEWRNKSLFEQATPEKLKWLYDRQLNHPGYSAFVESIGQENIIGTWDDHDFGLNNAGNDYEFRAESQQAFLDFLHVGPDDERRTRQGVYSFRDINDGLVRIITLDTRFFRDPYEKHDGDVLGEAQWAWLEKTLETSPAQFNLLVSGVQVLPDQAIRKFAENWSKLPMAYNRLMKLVTETRAKGIVFLSGDVHYAEMFQTNCTCANDKSFVLAEHTSSGMTHSWARYGQPRPWLIQSSFLTQPFYTTIPGSVYLDINFGELDFAGLGSDAASLTARILDEHGEQVYEHVWHSSDLKGEYRGEACECIPIQGRNAGTFEAVIRHVLFAFVFLSPLIAVVIPFIYLCGCCTAKSKLKKKSD